ncbi:hypothetical protein ACFX13_031171 [Malus domestica]|uniref:Uncharacterized protein n=1 Tax=Malus domestica TaxID=3750 RepID=A0A498KAR1_MALDO|nr:hypothetical protein DVH24_004096 [Malus domestica]
MPRYKDEPLAVGVYSVCDESRDSGESQLASHVTNPPLSRISSDQTNTRSSCDSLTEYFPSQSMNQTVKMVREKLSKVQSSSEHLQDERASKKTRVDSRRRI